MSHVWPTGPPQSLEALTDTLGGFEPHVRAEIAGHLPAEWVDPLWTWLGEQCANATQDELRDLALEEQPRSPRLASVAATLAPHRLPADDPLAGISPIEYVEVLSGHDVGPGGKALCPFHEDRWPSLHVWEDPARGWACFACPPAPWQRPGANHLGGDIYSFAAALWDLSTRRDFPEIRGRLLDLFSINQAAA